ncbi:Hypothetical predicted protein [Marmota monax]|uniref:Uncharacterized protein n=1 Tax=Marmota monax TaxID=9995 RepID=A0A5E4C2U1_MARMO|nr:Hypothetical predicted protein [Marmota monax]
MHPRATLKPHREANQASLSPQISHVSHSAGCVLQDGGRGLAAGWTVPGRALWSGMARWWDGATGTAGAPVGCERPDGAEEKGSLHRVREQCSASRPWGQVHPGQVSLGISPRPSQPLVPAQQGGAIPVPFAEDERLRGATKRLETRLHCRAWVGTRWGSPPSLQRPEDTQLPTCILVEV